MTAGAWRALTLAAALAAAAPAAWAKHGDDDPHGSRGKSAEHAAPGTPPTLVAPPAQEVTVPPVSVAPTPPPEVTAPERPAAEPAATSATAAPAEPAPGAPASTAPVAAPTAPVPSPPDANAPPSAPTHPRAGSGVSSTPAHASRRPAVSRPVVGNVFAAARTVAAPTRAFTPSTAAGERARPRPAAPRPAPAERPPAAVKPPTVTRTVIQVLESVPGAAWPAIAGLAGLGLLLGGAAAVQTVRRRRLDRIREGLAADVGVLQSALLPELPARIGGSGLSAAYRPADGLAAGGDFFDAFAIPGGRTAIIVGDVAGHGREVVPLTAAVRYGLRAYLEAGLAPRAVLQVAGSVLAAQLGGRHVTVIAAVHDPLAGTLTWSCAGHWPPLLAGVPGREITAASSPPLGSGMPTGRRQTTVAMPPGTAACFFTDGLTDVAVEDGRLGLSRLRDEVDELGPSLSATALLDRVVAVSAAQPDDMAACVLTALEAGATATSLRVEELEVDAEGVAGPRVERFLRACGADAVETARALEAAGATVALTGSAGIEVRTTAAGVEIRVGAPAAPPLRIAAVPAIAA